MPTPASRVPKWWSWPATAAQLASRSVRLQIHRPFVIHSFAAQVPCGSEKQVGPPKCVLRCRVPPKCHHTLAESKVDCVGFGLAQFQLTAVPTQAHACHFGPCPPCELKCNLPSPNKDAEGACACCSIAAADAFAGDGMRSEMHASLPGQMYAHALWPEQAVLVLMCFLCSLQATMW